MKKPWNLIQSCEWFPDEITTSITNLLCWAELKSDIPLLMDCMSVLILYTAGGKYTTAVHNSANHFKFSMNTSYQFVYSSPSFVVSQSSAKKKKNQLRLFDKLDLSFDFSLRRWTHTQRPKEEILDSESQGVFFITYSRPLYFLKRLNAIMIKKKFWKNKPRWPSGQHFKLVSVGTRVRFQLKSKLSSVIVSANSVTESKLKKLYECFVKLDWIFIDWLPSILLEITWLYVQLFSFFRME